jgi:hypothetical protein
VPQQIAHSLLQQADDVGHRQDHLDVGVLFGGEPAELLHGPLLVDLVSSLHSDSLLFLGRNPEAFTPPGLRVAYFLRTNGHPRFWQCAGVARLYWQIAATEYSSLVAQHSFRDGAFKMVEIKYYPLFTLHPNLSHKKA